MSEKHAFGAGNYQTLEFRAQQCHLVSEPEVSRLFNLQSLPFPPRPQPADVFEGNHMAVSCSVSLAVISFPLPPPHSQFCACPLLVLALTQDVSHFCITFVSMSILTVRQSLYDVITKRVISEKICFQEARDVVLSERHIIKAK